MLKPVRRDRATREAVQLLKDWTRERFSLAEDAVISVSELACRSPGCPPVETVVVFWTGAGTRHLYRVFKPVAAVTREDVPYSWLLNALKVPEGFGCDCC